MDQVKIKRRYPVHGVFVVYTFVVVLVAVGAFNANNNLLYWLFGLALGLLLVSGVVSGTMMMALRVRREVIQPGVAGEVLRVRYTVKNTSRFMPVMGVSIIEMVDTSARPGTHRCVLDAPVRAEVLHVPARSSVVVEAVVRPRGRGLLAFGGYGAATTFPFGIIKKTLWHEAPTSVIIQPASGEIDADAVRGRAGRSSGGQAGRVVGREGHEHVGLRDYAPGDPAKIVAWKASARLGRGELRVKQGATGTARKLWVRLRLEDGDSAEVVERAIGQAAGFLRAGVRQSMRVGLSISTGWGRGLDAPPGGQAGRSAALVNELALLPVRGDVGGQAVRMPGEQGGHRQGGPLSRLGSADVIIDIDAKGWRVVGDVVRVPEVPAGRAGA